MVASKQEFKRGDVVCKKGDADKHPNSVALYTLLEKRPERGDRVWLAAVTVGNGVVFLNESDLYLAEWDKEKKQPPKQSQNWQWGDTKRPDREPSAQAKRATPIHNPDRPKINAAGRFLVLTVMGTFTVLSQQVWIGYADTLLKQITRIPFLGLITQIPMAGGVVEFFGPWFPDLFGVGVWALINASQSGKHIIKLLDIRDPWWVTMLTDWSRPQYVALAYIAEIVLNYDRFPLFKGGIDYLISSYENLDMDLFLWPNVFFLLISVLSFEWLVKFFTPKSISSKGKK
jgi:hypothetical protein